MAMALLMAKSIFMYILDRYFLRGNYRQSENGADARACVCVRAGQNDLEVHYVLIRPFQGDLGTFSCVTSRLSHLSRSFDEEEKKCGQR